jgi:hypothetical protein
MALLLKVGQGRYATPKSCNPRYLLHIFGPVSIRNSFWRYRQQLVESPHYNDFTNTERLRRFVPVLFSEHLKPSDEKNHK